MSSPRSDILETAGRLFFSQGYTQTGINQLIDESGVARRTFYHHFESKEALGVAYLELAGTAWLASLRAAVAGRRSAGGAIQALFDHVQRFALDTSFRGCGILNLGAEFADLGNPVRVRVRETKLAQRNLVRELLQAFAVPVRIADQVSVLIEGAIALAAALADVAPIHSARDAALELLKNSQNEPP